jgi:cellulose synthase/poly-beta-1,6-N-acetylglucosamine synthase-like glycosyltransferase
MGREYEKRGLTAEGLAQVVRNRAGLMPFPDFLIPAFTPRQRLIHGLFLGTWIVALGILWSWWLQPEHRLDTLWFAVNSVMLAWVTLMPAYLLFVLGRGRIPNPAIPVPPRLRVAMVVTKVPSEPWPMVRHTLVTMLEQPYPHDTWLADEDPSPETISWCTANGVSVSTRRGCPDYHRAEWPRRRRCKEGNLAYFYDHFGYERYDFVIQLDADHVPGPTYLEEMLRPFIDPTVGYVSAPSICNRNATDSWSARSRLYAEGILHGGLQVGYNGGLAPLCFGSHYAVRTQALKEIGGLGPELAEDHSTTLLMNAHGWRGVHAVNAIAHGDGPETFGDLATQEFQWSRSLTTILLRYTPRYLRMLPWRLKLQFLFCQIWYVLFSAMMAVSYALPLIAIVNNRSMVNVAYLDFFVRFQLVTAILMAMGFWWHAKGWARPENAKAFSWESAVFLMARWPWSLLGVIAGAINVLSGKEANFRITPKASGTRLEVPFQVVLPYIFLSLCSSVCVLSANSEAVQGYYVFACINAVFYALVLAVILGMHWMEGKPSHDEVPCHAPGASQLGNWVRAMTVAATFFIGLCGVAKRGPQGAEFLLTGADGGPNTSYRLTHNNGGVNNHFISKNTKPEGPALAEVSVSRLAELKPGTPIAHPETSPDSVNTSLSMLEYSDLSGSLAEEGSWQAPLSQTNVDLPRPKATSRPFHPVSVRFRHHQWQHLRSRPRHEEPVIGQIAAYARHFLKTLGSITLASSSTRLAARTNAKH